MPSELVDCEPSNKMKREVTVQPHVRTYWRAAWRVLDGHGMDAPALAELDNLFSTLPAHSLGRVVGRQINRDPPGWLVRIDAAKQKQPRSNQTKVSHLETTKNSLKFEAIDESLPVPTPPADAPESVIWMGGKRAIRINGLEPGRYTLKVDGKPLATLDQGIWDQGVPLATGPEFDQVEALRSAINRKNLLYFYRWRPQNETYLFGFRKHEQGNNAVEIPKFDPLVEEQEKAIAKLRQPVPHIYELTVESEVPK